MRNHYSLRKWDIFVMRIGMILEGVFPPDIRVEKEVRRLLDNGYEVFLLSTWKTGLKYEETINGLQISRIVMNDHLINNIFNDAGFQFIFYPPRLEKKYRTFCQTQ